MRIRYFLPMGVILLMMVIGPAARGHAQEPSVTPAVFQSGPFYLDGAAASSAADRANAWNGLSSCQQRSFLLANASRLPPEALDLGYSGTGRGKPRRSVLRSLSEYFLGKPAYATDCGSAGHLYCPTAVEAVSDDPVRYTCCTPPEGLPCKGWMTVHRSGVECRLQMTPCPECNDGPQCNWAETPCRVCTWTYYDCDECCPGCLDDITLPCGLCQCNVNGCYCSTNSTCSPNPPDCLPVGLCPTSLLPPLCAHHG